MSLFKTGSYGEWQDVDSRLHCVRRCQDIAALRAELAARGDTLQKTVRRAIEQRIRRLERGTPPAVLPT